MEHLPLEVARSIIKQLGFRDYYHCLSVNKFFYALVIELVYKELFFWGRRKWEMFLTALITYDRCRECVHFTKAFNVSFLPDLYPYQVTPTLSMDFIDALAFLPNLETLVVDSHADIIQAILGRRMPKMEKLRILDFNHRCGAATINEGMIDCSWKHKSTLTHLNINKLTHSISTLPSLVSFLGAFPRLLDLRIDAQLFRKQPMLDHLLEHCPGIVRMDLKCDALNSPLTRKKSQVSDLRLKLKKFRHADLHYLNTTTPHLRHLKVMCDQLLHPSDVVRSLMQMSRLDLFEIKQSSSPDLIRAFWKYIEHAKTRKAVFMMAGKGGESSTVSMTRCPVTKLRTMKSVSSLRTYAHSLTQLEDIGRQLTELRIDKQNIPSSIDLNTINRLCPHLSILGLIHHGLLESGDKIVPNPNLLSLSIEGPSVNDATFKMIQDAYPSLRSLELAHLDFQLNHQPGSHVRVGYLPEGLQHLVIKMDPYEKYTLLVIKLVEGEAVRTWHSDGCEVVETEQQEEVEAVVKELAEEPLILFQSSTVHSVSISTY
ncbi:hypothetical protein BDB01DRAFT_852302 [Pilobolus umbonatus]|nr:hypothetical protein BDB01DRAFT_852302 [Pilobolus umbonatus]